MMRAIVTSLAFVFLVGACSSERDINSELVVAARAGDLAKVADLVDRGANVNGREKVEGEGRSPLYHAAGEGNLEVLKLLLSKGADPNEQPPGRASPLMSAAYSGHTEVVRALLEAGASVNATSEYGWTALTRAARNGHLETVKLLVKHGADVNHRLADGNTALSTAKAHKHVLVVDELRKAGASG